ncbi:hypothetical protein [Chamaesiphon sp. OTE_75_metabat_556]|uniref:hypothetical protein n=1 Tax=Chamaesiphon sp. OTE_75_metabat_556 TaxID=2964692 RepID=UPI00286BDEC3|nr:hypothetical protein [Chamaesiphon sp. OTE_75_metabat_556]
MRLYHSHYNSDYLTVGYANARMAGRFSVIDGSEWKNLGLDLVNGGSDLDLRAFRSLQEDTPSTFHA